MTCTVQGGGRGGFFRKELWRDPTQAFGTASGGDTFALVFGSVLMLHKRITLTVRSA